jgi:hypothetical protein
VRVRTINKDAYFILSALLNCAGLGESVRESIVLRVD